MMLGFGWVGSAACVAMVGCTRIGVAAGRGPLRARVHRVQLLAGRLLLAAARPVHARRTRPRLVGRLGDLLPRRRSTARRRVHRQHRPAQRRAARAAGALRVGHLVGRIQHRAVAAARQAQSDRRRRRRRPARRGRIPTSGATLRELRQYPVTLGFLIAFLVYNDGIQTVTTVSAQYGDKELHLSNSTLLLGILIVQFVAYGGAIWLGRLAGRWGAKRVILASLVVWLIAIGFGYVMQARAPLQFYALAVADRGRARRQPGAVAIGLLAIDSARIRGALLRVLRDQRRGTSWLGPLLFGSPTRTPAATGPPWSHWSCSSSSVSCCLSASRSGGVWPRPETRCRRGYDSAPRIREYVARR